MAKNGTDNDVEGKLLSVQRRMGKNLAYEDLEQIIGNLQSKLDDYRQIEANARAIFNEFKQMAERLRSGIYRYDIKSHRFLFFNQHMIHMLGSKASKASDITSKSVLLRVHPDDRERARQAAENRRSRSVPVASWNTGSEKATGLIDGIMTVGWFFAMLPGSRAIWKASLWTSLKISMPKRR